MRVRMKTTAAGPGGAYMAGTMADVEPEQARAWVVNGYAEYVDPAPIEEAVIEAAETATIPRRKQRGR
jgi:hypothetical protein